MNLFAEVERLDFASDALNNYTDRLIEDLAKKIHEEEGGSGSV